LKANHNLTVVICFWSVINWNFPEITFSTHSSS